MSYYTLFLFLYLWGLCMLSFLDNCPIFVLQPLRGKTVSHCREICNLWYAEELSLWGQKQYRGFATAALLCSSAHMQLRPSNTSFLYVLRWAVWKPTGSQILAMLPRDQYWDQYCSKSSLTAWATEWSTPSAYPWMVPNWGVWRGCESTTGLLFRGSSTGQRSELMKNLMQNLTKSKCKVTATGQ